MVCKGIGLIAILVITANITPVFGLTEWDRVTITEPRLEQWGSGGITVERINVNQQIQISADIKNNQNESQNFVYLIQIKDDRGFVVSIGWISGQLTPDQRFSPSLSWIPSEPGEFTGEIYAWEGIANHKALSDYVLLQISVS